MTGRKVDFVVERSDELQEAAIDLRAGTHVTLSSDESTGQAQVHCEGQVLGHVPADQQQHLSGSSCSCTVRSVKRQDGKITQILVRAVLSNADLKRLPGMVQLPCSDAELQPMSLQHGELVCTCSLSHSVLLHAELPATDSAQPEELEGTTQLPQHQLELLGNNTEHLQHTCNAPDIQHPHCKPCTSTFLQSMMSPSGACSRMSGFRKRFLP